MSRPAASLLWLTVPALSVALVLADEIREGNPAALEREYAVEQAKIDLVFAEYVLQASRGDITPEEAQTGIDEWIRANTARLQAQVERAAELDRIAPLPPEPVPPGPRELNPHFKDAERAQRYADLEDAEAEAIAAIAARAESPEHRQALVDEWAHGGEGEALLKEKQDLWAEAAAERPLGTEPVVLEVPENAEPEEIEALDWHERSARRVMDIRKAHPEATPEEMQDYIDERREEFEEDRKQIARLMAPVAHRRLEAEVARLRAAAAGEETEAETRPEETGETETGAESAEDSAEGGAGGEPADRDP